jgi:hypothetical protein
VANARRDASARRQSRDKSTTIARQISNCAPTKLSPNINIDDGRRSGNDDGFIERADAHLYVDVGGKRCAQDDATVSARRYDNVTRRDKPATIRCEYGDAMFGAQSTLKLL